MTAVLAEPPARPAAGAAAAAEWSIVEAAQAGDADAFAQLHTRYYDTVFRFVYHRVLRNRAVAEDLTAEVFLRGLRRIGTVTWQGRDIGAWFVTIARNLVADHFKSGRYRLELLTRLDDPDAEGEPDEDLGPAELAERQHVAQVVRAAVETLSAEQRMVVQLRYFDQLSTEETARLMGKQEGAIKAMLYRALRSLRRNAPGLEALR